MCEDISTSRDKYCFWTWVDAIWVIKKEKKKLTLSASEWEGEANRGRISWRECEAAILWFEINLCSSLGGCSNALKNPSSLYFLSHFKLVDVLDAHPMALKLSYLSVDDVQMSEWLSENIHISSIESTLYVMVMSRMMKGKSGMRKLNSTDFFSILFLVFNFRYFDSLYSCSLLIENFSNGNRKWKD